MQEQDLVSVAAAPEDARISIVSLNAEGLRRVQAVIASTKKLFDDAFLNMNAKELDTLNSTLQKLFHNITE